MDKIIRNVYTVFPGNLQPDINLDNIPLVVSNCGYAITKGRNSVFNIANKAKDCNDWVLIYQHEGQVAYGDKRNIVKGKSVLLLPPKENNSVYYLDENINKRYYVFFRGRDAGEILTQFGLEKNKRIYPTGDLTILIDYFNKIIMDYNIRGLDEYIYRTYYLMKILKTISDAYKRNVNKSSEDKEILEILEYMQENYMKVHKLEDYAKKVNMSTPTFIRRFTKKTGETPINYLTKLRIKQAEHFLHSTNMSIKEIAYNVGIDNNLYFSHMFKKYTGKTPTEFRDEITSN